MLQAITEGDAQLQDTPHTARLHIRGASRLTTEQACCEEAAAAVLQLAAMTSSLAGLGQRHAESVVALCECRCRRADDTACVCDPMYKLAPQTVLEQCVL
jgi:hypothetical protein